MNVIDEYLQTVTPSQKVVLEHIRDIILKLAPEAEQRMGYGIPEFRYNKQPLLYFAAFKNHMSMFPASDDMIAAVGKDLEKFRAAKGTLHFTEDTLIPDAMLQKIIEFRLVAVTQK
jgi:uncharacterized protein YdhG (YjbR/CyaY superfamily)